MKTGTFLIIAAFFINANIAMAQSWAGQDGDANDPYLINNAIEMKEFADSVNIEGINYSGKHFKLTSDINLISYTNWDPIGGGNNPFSGTFDGGGFLVSNLNINNPKDSAGLFGYIENGSIRNLGVEIISITANRYVGGLVGVNHSGIIENCHTIGIINGLNYVGGLVGQNVRGSIRNCYATDTINGSIHVGGLVGESLEGNIRSSYATGAITGSSYAGGLVGMNRDNNIENSYSTCVVKVSGVVAGGLVGSNNGGNIRSCYSTGTLIGSGNSFGGLVGANNSTITGSYAIACNGRYVGNGNTGGVESISNIRGKLGSSWSSSVWSISGNNYPYLSELAKYNVTFSGSSITIPSVVTNANTEIFAPGEPFHTGHIFDGWYKESTFINEWDFCDPVIANTTLYARWAAVPGATAANIIIQPQGASVCPGSNYTMTVVATGSHLRYQWYKSDQAIEGANGAALSIENASTNDYGLYTVSVQAIIGEAVYSNDAIVIVANPLPESLSFAVVPQEPIEMDIEYPVEVNAYSDVTSYSWSSESGTVAFWPMSRANTNARFTQPGDDIIRVRLSHTCGERIISYPVKVQPPTGSEHVAGSTFTIYPNPVSDVVNITGLTAGEVIKLYNASGSLVATYISEDIIMSINISDLGSGIYYLNVADKTMKIIKN